MNSSGDPAFCTAFWTVSGEQATRICTLAVLAGAALTVAAKPCAAASRLPLCRSVRAGARLAGAVRPGAAGDGRTGVRDDGMTGAGVAVATAADATGRGVLDAAGVVTPGEAAACFGPGRVAPRPQMYQAPPM